MAKLLGLDPGTRRCGVAVTDSQQTLAFAREALPVDEHLLSRLRSLIDDELIEGVVVGRPTALVGRATASTSAADEFFQLLLDEFPNLAMEQVDERLSTVEAQRALRSAGLSVRDQRAVIDSAAAVVLLQNFLDGRRVD